MKKRLPALCLLVMLLFTLVVFPAVSFAKAQVASEYEYIEIPGLDSYNRVAAENAQSYVISVNGVECAVVSADETAIISAAEYFKGEACSVSVAAVYENGEKVFSENVEVSFGGVGEFTPGDIDADGEVTVSDALAVLRVSAGLQR